MVADSDTNRQITLAKYVTDMPGPDNFALNQTLVPEPADGQFVVRNEYLSFAPAIRSRIGVTPWVSLEPIPLGSVLGGQTVGRICKSRHPDFTKGNYVALLNGGWQDYAICDGTGAHNVSPDRTPLQKWLGMLGTSGLTAWVGIRDIGALQPQETLLVSAAAGSVGSLAGQFGKLSGCRVVGIAGGPEKCRQVVEQLGFNDCVDYKSAAFPSALASACPDGVDVYFDNVGGKVRDVAFAQMSLHGRVVVCGMVSEYSGQPAPGPDWSSVLFKRLTIRGFVLSDKMDRRDDFLDEVLPWVESGKLVESEQVVTGLENAPAALSSLLSGETSGKLVIKLT